MAFAGFSEFLAMGGHGLYVWMSYGATYLVIGLLLWHNLRAHRRQRARLRSLRRRSKVAQETTSAAQETR